jgi:hypothetical protein
MQKIREVVNTPHRYKLTCFHIFVVQEGPKVQLDGTGRIFKQEYAVPHNTLSPLYKSSVYKRLLPPVRRFELSELEEYLSSGFDDLKIP